MTQLNWTTIEQHVQNLLGAISCRDPQYPVLIEQFSQHASWSVLENLFLSSEQINPQPRFSAFDAFCTQTTPSCFVLDHQALELCCAQGYNFLRDSNFVRTPFYCPTALSMNSLAVAAETLQQLADKHRLQGVNGEHLLHFAAGFLWHPEILERCCTPETINNQDNKGDTPLHCIWDGVLQGAYDLRHVTLSWILIKNGADVLIPNHAGRTILHHLNVVDQEATYLDDDDQDEQSFHELRSYVLAQISKRHLTANVSSSAGAGRVSKM